MKALLQSCGCESNTFHSSLQAGFQNTGRGMLPPQSKNMQMRSGQLGAGKMQMGGGQVGAGSAIAGGFPSGMAFPPPHNQGQQGSPNIGSGVQMGQFPRLMGGPGPAHLPMPGPGMPPAPQDARLSQPNAWGMPSQGLATLHGLQGQRMHGLLNGPGGTPSSVPMLAGVPPMPFCLCPCIFLFCA